MAKKKHQTKPHILEIELDPGDDSYPLFNFKWHTESVLPHRQHEIILLFHTVLVMVQAWGTPDYAKCDFKDYKTVFECVVAGGAEALFSFVESIKNETLRLNLGDAMRDEWLNFLASGFDSAKGFPPDVRAHAGRITTEIYPLLVRLGVGAESQDKPPAPVRLQGPNGDFTRMRWGGDVYSFALGKQSGAVKALWEEWKKSGMGLHQNSIGQAVDAERDNFRMDITFRNHPAFGKIIVALGEGVYGLATPDATNEK